MTDANAMVEMVRDTGSSDLNLGHKSEKDTSSNTTVGLARRARETAHALLLEHASLPSSLPRYR